MWIRGVNIQTHLDILCKTEIARNKPRPKLEVLFRSNSQRRMGTAWPHQNRIILYVRPSDEWYDIVATLCHEVAHCFTPSEHHSRVWKKAYQTLAFQAYGVNIKANRQHIQKDPQALHNLLKSLLTLKRSYTTLSPMNEQSETVTEQSARKAGRKAGSKNLPIPEAWQGLYVAAGETKGALAEALGVSYPTLRKAMSERAPTQEEVERVRIVAESNPAPDTQAAP